MTALAIVELLGGWRAAVFAALCVALGATAMIQSSRLSKRTAERDQQKALVATWKQVNSANVQAIAELREANDTWASIARDTEKRAADAVAAVAGERDALAAEFESRRRARSEIYRGNQDAAAWSRTAVPDVVVRQLRE